MLHAHLNNEIDLPVIPAGDAMTAHLREIYGEAVDAVLFYGSCLRAESDEDLLMDFYVLVRRYSDVHGSGMVAALNWLLPPNVYYFEIPFEGRVARAKVAVMTTAQFHRAATSGFTSAIWARFSQPTRLTFVRGTDERAMVLSALERAVGKMLAAARPVAPNQNADALWVTALKHTYGAELRPESPGRAQEIYEKDKTRYDALAAELVVQGPRPPALPHHLLWMLRSIAGKLMNILRLVKAARTFSGGLDYAVWKMERHSGVKIELTDEERARPLRTGLKLFWKARRSGAIK